MEGNAVLFILVLYPMIMAVAAYVMGRKGKEGGVKAAIAAGVIEFALVAGTVLCWERQICMCPRSAAWDFVLLWKASGVSMP